MKLCLCSKHTRQTIHTHVYVDTTSIIIMHIKSLSSQIRVNQVMQYVDNIFSIFNRAKCINMF